MEIVKFPLTLQSEAAHMKVGRSRGPVPGRVCRSRGWGGGNQRFLIFQRPQPTGVTPGVGSGARPQLSPALPSTPAFLGPGSRLPALDTSPAVPQALGDDTGSSQSPIWDGVHGSVFTCMSPETCATRRKGRTEGARGYRTPSQADSPLRDSP